MLATLGARLNSTVRAYNETVGSYEARVLPGARRFAEHGAVPEGSELPALEPVTTSARTLSIAETDVAPEDEFTARRLFAAD